MNAKIFLLGLTTGAIGGAAAVLFSTPQSGSQLRQNIANNTYNAKLKLADVKYEAHNVMQSVSALKSEVQNNIPTIINEMKESITLFTQDIQPETEKLLQEIESLQNSINEIEKIIPSNENKTK